MKLPTGAIVDKNTPIYSGSNFTWGEATNNCTRQIEDLAIDDRLLKSAYYIEKNIIATAKKLDKIRAILGNRPLWVNSWYRPSKVNARVGGGRYSRHQFGDAVDIKSNYYSPYQIYKILDRQHPDGGLGKYYSFTHIDWRGEYARW